MKKEFLNWAWPVVLLFALTLIVCFGVIPKATSLLKTLTVVDHRYLFNIGMFILTSSMVVILALITMRKITDKVVTPIWLSHRMSFLWNTIRGCLFFGMGWMILYFWRTGSPEGQSLAMVMGILLFIITLTIKDKEFDLSLLRKNRWSAYLVISILTIAVFASRVAPLSLLAIPLIVGIIFSFSVIIATIEDEDDRARELAVIHIPLALLLWIIGLLFYAQLT